jgi:hypothetical protein
MYRSCISGLLGGLIGLVGATQAVSQQQCKPSLGFTEVQFSKMQLPTLERKWTAVVNVDASRCVANSAGYFEIAFSRSKEMGIEVEFREEFMWLGSAPSVAVEVNFWADEAVERYWFGTITPCACRKWGNTSENIR